MGTIIGQAINFFGMIVIGRIYLPEDIGDYALIIADSGVICSIVTLGMMTTFMLPKEDDEARALATFVTKTMFVLSIAIVGILFAFSGVFQIIRTEHVSYSASLLILLVYVMSYTINGICYGYANRLRLYKVMFWNPIINSVVNIGLCIVFGLMHFGFVGYTGAHILAFVATIIHLCIAANPYKGFDKSHYSNKLIINSYKNFPLYVMPANIVSSLSTQIPVQIFSTVYTATVLGMYSMSLQVLSLPISLLAAPINRVFFREASDRFNKEEDIGEFSFRFLKTGVKIAILPIVILTIFGEEIFSLFLGGKWETAGWFAAIIATYQMLLFCFNCLSGHFVIIKKNNYNLYYSIFTVLMNLLVFVIAIIFRPNVEVILVLLSVTGILGIMLFQGIFMHMTGFKVYKYLEFIFIWIFLPMAFAWTIRLLIK